MRLFLIYLMSIMYISCQYREVFFILGLKVGNAAKKAYLLMPGNNIFTGIINRQRSFINIF